jgi:hypothetical protein
MEYRATLKGRSGVPQPVNKRPGGLFRRRAWSTISPTLNGAGPAARWPAALPHAQALRSPLRLIVSSGTLLPARAAIADHGYFIGEAVALPAEYATPVSITGQHETTIQSSRSPSGGVGARSSARKREPRLNIPSPFSWLTLGIVALVGVFAYVNIKRRRRTHADRQFARDDRGAHDLPSLVGSAIALTRKPPLRDGPSASRQD